MRNNVRLIPENGQIQFPKYTILLNIIACGMRLGKLNTNPSRSSSALNIYQDAIL